MSDYAKAEASIICERLTDGQKRAALEALSEDDFRDKVVGPLYVRMKYTHLRDTCGADEQGKDRIFTLPDPLGGRILIGVQTKAGAVTMAGSKPTAAVTVIETQLEMTLKTSILLENNATKMKPLQAHLCASGKVSNSARQYLNEKLDTHRIRVLGADELIPLIDEHYNEYWLGIDADRFPYLRALRRRLCEAEDVIRITQLTGAPGGDSPVADENYLRLRLTRLEAQVVHKKHELKLKHHQKATTIEVQHRPKWVDIPVEALVDQNHRLTLITGEGGSGKTTALRRLAVTLIDKVLGGSTSTPIPVVLRAKTVAASDQTLTEEIAEETADIGGGKSPFGAEDLEKGNVAILVDALEEVDEKAREKVLTLALEFHEKYPKCMIVFTSRDYRSILELAPLTRFVHYWILPIGLREVDGLITRVIERKQVDKEVVRTTLKRLNETHGLSLSPMLITVFLSSSDFSKQDLPPNIAEIFKKFTEQMIGRWDTKKGLDQQYEAGTKDYLLRLLAFTMHQRRDRSIAIEEVQKMFAAELAKKDLAVDSDRIFDEVVHRSGLLRSDGKVLEWRHHLLQEYFAGRGAPNAQFFADVVHDEWWRTPMIFYFGDKPESFADLGIIMRSTGGLDLAPLFDAAITIGLSVQACYLADMQQKADTIAWVIASFAKSMGEYRKAIDGRDGRGKGLMALCAMIALGRDAVATRTLLRLPATIGEPAGQKDALFKPIDQDRVETWRIVGLLEAGELEAAIERLHSLKTKDRDLIFMLHVSICWALYYQEVKGETKKQLEHISVETGSVVEDMRQDLFKELKSLFFQIRSGRFAAVIEGGDEETKKLPAPAE